MDLVNLKNYLDRLISDYAVPGVDCIVMKEHEEIFRYYAGVSDLESEKKLDGNELYIAFSMTKLITCICALQLMEKGAYTLDDPLAMYMPEFSKMRISNGNINCDKFAKNPITIRHLFTMSAGLDYDVNADCIKKSLAEGKKSTRELVSSLADTVLGFEPGTRFRYSLCHDVLGALIEIWSEITFGEYVRKNITEPLGMKDTFFGLPKDRENLARVVTRYAYDTSKKPQRQTLECIYNLSDEYESGGAGLVTTTLDYSIFLDALACAGAGENGRRIISPSSIELMKTNHLSGEQLDDFYQLRQGYGYGLGVRTHIDKVRSGSISPLGEFGWDGAGGTFSMVDTENKLSLTYFQQVHGWDKRIQTEMRNALYSDLKIG